MRFDEKAVIFIGGTAYSGSTILDLMLSNSEDDFSCGEINALFRPYRSHHFNPQCACHDNSCNIWERAYRNGETNLWRHMSYILPHVKYFVDSSKDLVWLKDQQENTESEGIKKINLLIWKTPSEYALSKLKRNKLKGWKKSYIKYHKRYFSIIDDWVSIKYSDLALDVKRKLNSICKYIGMSYFDGMEEYWKKSHHTLYGSNSAKIQLYDLKSPAFKNIKKEQQVFKKGLNQEMDIEIERHKTIFYDQRGKARLPEAICQEIESDNELSKILKVLEAKEINNILDKESPAIEQLCDWKSHNAWYFYRKANRYFRFFVCKSMRTIRKEDSL